MLLCGGLCSKCQNMHSATLPLDWYKGIFLSILFPLYSSRHSSCHQMKTKLNNTGKINLKFWGLLLAVLDSCNSGHKTSWHLLNSCENYQTMHWICLSSLTNPLFSFPFLSWTNRRLWDRLNSTLQRGEVGKKWFAKSKGIVTLLFICRPVRLSYGRWCDTRQDFCGNE